MNGFGGKFKGQMTQAKQLTALAMLGLGSFAAAQAPLTLDQALQMAKERNGTIRAAHYNYLSASERITQAFSAFLPNVAATYTYTSGQQQFLNLGAKQYGGTEGGKTNVALNYQILDLGERKSNLNSAGESAASQRYATLQTYRSTLFAVVSQYYETLRAQELQKVADQQVAQTDLILKQTVARIAVHDEAAKDQLQAEADYLNAKVQTLISQNRTSNAVASLKSLVGLESGNALPMLTAPQLDAATAMTSTLEESIATGIKARADLEATRRSIASLRFQKQIADRQAGISASLDAQVGDQVTPTNLFGRSLTLSLSYPLFDGGKLKSIARQQGLNIKAAEQSLLQAERDARAEIESAYKETSQNAERLAAAQKAIEAAQKNFDAAVDSQRLGASSIIEVSAARVSLVTAQSEYIQAIYDLAISRSRLDLVTGKKMQGE